mmetsp:Transcript_18334/g.27670  ORF Transcript_18334/g.27670 Transcript_18334/m.27670 type:complete len:166 (+) Transcript_18334:68-565(+)
MVNFAETLTNIVREARKKEGDRKKEAKAWLAHENKLLDEAVEAFKKKCMKAAEDEKSEASISFEVLTRDISSFPTRQITNNTHHVDDWGDGSAAGWHYAHRGTAQEFQQGTKVNVAELLEAMMPKFIEKVNELGFDKCVRVPGTWKVTASWGGASEPASKKHRSS